ncbi:hypothetical protein C8R44DRAFT_257761 [Mycena epipterygia]|nr:hypothetical protein C8R44DRAFT_257761 [Mycena epipterygia]
MCELFSLLAHPSTMAPQPTLTQIRLNNIITCLTLTITTLDELQDVFGTPFIGVILSTTVSLIAALDMVKRNKDGCAQLMEDIHYIIYAIINLHMRSEPRGELSPEVLHYIGKFADTLHKIHGFIEAQQDGNKFKQLFRQSEMNQVFYDCNKRLQEILDIFKVEINTGVTFSIDDMRKATEKQQQELLELITTLSDDRGSSVRNFNIVQYQSNEI